MRSRRLPQSTIEQVHIARDWEHAITTYADPAFKIVNLKLGPEIEIANLCDRQILDLINEVIAPQDASIADPANRPIEISKRRLQIEWL